MAVTVSGSLWTPIATGRTPADLTFENLAETLDRAERDGFAGAVLVVRDGDVVIDQGYGLANREKHIENRRDTVFAVGSVPIDFTNAGILWLMEQGKVGRHDRIELYFDDVPDDKYQITVDHLMTGASGLLDFHDLPGDRDPDHHYIDRDEAVRRILAHELLFPPGHGRQHSHSAWGLLAAIIEIASGQTYQDFTREHLFGPAGMKDTAFHGDPVAEDRLAIGYGFRSDGEINAPPYWGEVSWLVMGSGGMVSTTGDLRRWYQFLRSGELLSDEGQRAYFSPPGEILAAGNMYGFEILYTEGPDTMMVFVSNNNTPDQRDANAALGEAIGALIGEALRGGVSKESAGAVFPDSPRGEHAAAFFTAFNSGDAERYVEFGHQHRVAVDKQDEADLTRAGQYPRFRDDWGDLTIVGVREFQNGGIEVIARGSALDGALRFAFDFDPAPPHLIRGIAISPTEDPDQALDHEPWDDLTELLERARRRFGVPAIAAAITHGGEIVESAAVGVRSVNGDDPVSLDDRFHWGSVGKSVTGTVIGKLIEDGRLTPELTLGEALPDVAMHPQYRDVTLEQLMAHRGGVPARPPGTQIFGDAGELDPVAARGAMTAAVLARPPAYQPGGDFVYSNAGISIAAHIAELRAGESWRELVRKHVFSPAGMTHAGFGWPRDVGPNQPGGHRVEDGEAEPADEASLPFHPGLDPAGNVHSSIEDMARYAAYHLRGLRGQDGHLKASSIQRIHTPAEGRGERYAFGWSIERWPDPSTECHWHNGSGGTFFAIVKLLPDQDLGLTLLMNAYPGEAPVADSVFAAWLRRHPL